MRNYFRCPRCKKYSLAAKQLRCSWTCPNCHTSIIPKENRKVNQFMLKKFQKSKAV